MLAGVLTKGRNHVKTKCFEPWCQTVGRSHAGLEVQWLQPLLPIESVAQRHAEHCDASRLFGSPTK